MRTIIVWILLPLAGISPTAVSAASLDFEGLPFTLSDAGGPVTPIPSSVLTTDFESLGVLFGRAGISAGVAVFQRSDPASLAPSSGLNSVVGLDVNGIIPGMTGGRIGDIYFSFVIPASLTPGFTDSVSFTIGDGGGDVDSFQIRSYDLADMLIDSRDVSGVSRFAVNIDRPGIHRVEIDFLPADFGYSLDDLQFITPVPEPSILALLAMGSGVLGLVLRKRARE